MRNLLVGVVIGLVVGAGAALLALRASSDGLIVTYTATGLSTAPDWIARGFQRYEWSRVVTGRRWDGSYGPFAIAYQHDDVPSSYGCILAPRGGEWRKDKAWVAFDAHENVVAVESWNAGVIDSDVAFRADPDVAIHLYEQGTLTKTVQLIAADRR